MNVIIAFGRSDYLATVYSHHGWRVPFSLTGF
jgi:hypothetical protein